MTRIAVIGPGQVGAEVALLLRGRPGVEVVPVTRNPSGSAFLRSQGMQCRHGLVSDPRDAPNLIADCDVIANFALSTDLPKEAREQHRRILENIAKFSAPTARIIYFSTIMVYGTPSADGDLHSRSAYAREKRWGEQIAIGLGTKTNQQVFVLRLGHVCGPLQNISFKLQNQIRTGMVGLPHGGEIASNAVYSVTVAQAIDNIARGLEQPGIYDLLCVPEWTWRQVYLHEAAAIGLPLVVESIAKASRIGPLRRTFNRVGNIGRKTVRSQFVKQLTLSLLAYAPARFGRRVQALHFSMRAAAEIQALATEERCAEELSWPPLGRRFLSSLSPTLDLLKRDGRFTTHIENTIAIP